MTPMFDDELSERIAAEALAQIQKVAAHQSAAGEGGPSIDRDDLVEAIQEAAYRVMRQERQKRAEADGEPSNAKPNGKQTGKPAAQKAGITITGL